MGSKWKKSWKSSKQPSKQRKYRNNAPYHHRKKMVTATLSESVRESVGTRSLPLRTGDKVEIMRGEWADLGGVVASIDYDSNRVYIDGIDRERVDSTDTKIALDPSNLKITKLELDDDRRLEKYDVSEEEKEEIRAEVEAEEETADEDEEQAETEEAEEDSEDEGPGAGESDAPESDIDYEALSNKNISDIKAQAEERELDYEKLLEAEKANKDRKTLKNWVESQIEQEGDE